MDPLRFALLDFLRTALPRRLSLQLEVVALRHQLSCQAQDHERTERRLRIRSVQGIMNAPRRFAPTADQFSPEWWSRTTYAALELCDRGYLLESASVALAGTGRQSIDNPHVKQTYLGA